MSSTIVFLSIITDKDESEVKVVGFSDREDAIRYNARVALKIAKEAVEQDPNEDDEEIIDRLQSAFDDEDWDEFADACEDSFLSDRYSFDVKDADVHARGYWQGLPEGEMFSW